MALTQKLSAHNWPSTAFRHAFLAIGVLTLVQSFFLKHAAPSAERAKRMEVMNSFCACPCTPQKQLGTVAVCVVLKVFSVSEQHLNRLLLAACLLNGQKEKHQRTAIPLQNCPRPHALCNLGHFHVDFCFIIATKTLDPAAAQVLSGDVESITSAERKSETATPLTRLDLQQ